MSFTNDLSSPLVFGTVAKFSCDAGFSLNGDTATLTCVDDDQADTIGTWGGTEPSCLGTLGFVRQNLYVYTVLSTFCSN